MNHQNPRKIIVTSTLRLLVFAEPYKKRGNENFSDLVVSELLLRKVAEFTGKKKGFVWELFDLIRFLNIYKFSVEYLDEEVGLFLLSILICTYVLVWRCVDNVGILLVCL